MEWEGPQLRPWPHREDTALVSHSTGFWFCVVFIAIHVYMYSMYNTALVEPKHKLYSEEISA